MNAENLEGPPSVRLKKWLEFMGNLSNDPWPGSLQGERDYCDSTPLDDEVIANASIDPTASFADITDEWPETESESEETEIDFVYRGKKDTEGRFHYYGTVTFDNGNILTSEFEHGIRHGEAVIISERTGISRLCGNYNRGRLHGRGKMVSNKTEVSEVFFKSGVLHGPCRRVAMKKFREFRQQLDFVGAFRCGKPFGWCWEYREGGGYLTGEVDEDGKFTGGDIAFLYPDLSTALVGRFEDGIMMEARETHLTDVSLDLTTYNMRATFAEPKANSSSVKYSKATSTFIGSDPLVPDPYESKMVEVRKSHVENSGSGLFAKQKLPKGTIAAFYNGIRLPYKLGQPKEVWETSGYKIYINADYASGERMDIPEDCIDTNNYCATLGHKLNHSFQPNCEEWFFDHPRFGLLPCERTLRDIEAGEELFLDYEYDPYNCPEWFRDQLIAFKKQKSEEELSELNVKYSRFIIDA